MTRNAALSLGKKNVGIIEEGAQADLLAWKYDNLAQIPYYNVESERSISHYIRKGKITTAEKLQKKLK